MVNFKVAIPSHNRAEALRDYTLSTILKKNIDPSCINIFVANQQDYDDYKRIIPSDMYNEIIITAKGKNNAMNHIRRFYKKGERLLNLDDDISDIHYGYNGYNIPLTDLNSYSNYIFKIMKKYKMGMCGILRHSKPSLKKNTLTINTYELDGNLYWTINNSSKKLDVYLPYCIDAEFCLKNSEYYGNVMRNNEISITNKSVDTDAGLIRLAYNGEKVNARIKLLKEFPKLIELNYTSKDDTYPYALKFKLINSTITIPTVVKKW